MQLFVTVSGKGLAGAPLAPYNKEVNKGTPLMTLMTNWTKVLPIPSLQAEVPEGGWPINWEAYDQMLESAGGDTNEVYLSVIEAAAQLKKEGDLNQASYVYAQALAFESFKTF